MTSRDFCYWLQGFFEINGKSESLSRQQVAMVKKHLAMVFKHEIDPSFKDTEDLNNIHNEATKATTNPGPPSHHDDYRPTVYRC